MYKVSDELNINLINWAEGNEYLYSLLYLSWQHGIRTGACCGGHIDHKENDPYILFIVDENNLSYFESMIGAIEKIPDIKAEINYRNNPSVNTDSKIVFGVHSMMHNRMEMFYKLSSSILEKNEIETPGGRKFYQDLVKLLNKDKNVLESEINNGVVVGSTFNTFTKEREKYLNDKKKLLYRLRQVILNKHSKYDGYQERIDLEPQIKMNK